MKLEETVKLDAEDLVYLEDEDLEAENRMKNLMWTVSGDYKLDTKLDVASFRECKYAAIYDAVKQGAFARFFDKNAFALYLVKKIYCGAEEVLLTSLAQLCVETASYPRIVEERPGIKEIREKAFSYLLDHKFEKMSSTLIGKIKIVLMRGALEERWECEQRIREPLEKIRALETAESTMELICTVDSLYHDLIDPEFEKKHGNLQSVLDVELEELQEFNWKDFLEEDAYENLLEQYVQQMEQQMTSFESMQQEEKKPEGNSGRRRTVLLDSEAVAKMYSYIEKSYGRSYLNEYEQHKVNERLCRGAHADCSLYYTEGILHSPVMHNAQLVNTKNHVQQNKRLFLNNQNVIKRNVEMMTDYLKRSLHLRTEADVQLAHYGMIQPRHLWKIGRVSDPGKLFYRAARQDSSDFVVQILMDASGSQRDRQGQVALQAYIISEALSNAALPHQIMSFCTFWDYTVMQRFRDYDSPRSENKRVLEFVTSSNNRDGLAIRAAGDSLLQREEENKILIVLSDGKPNDVIVNRPGSRNPRTYSGDYAVTDTAFEVRSLRNQGIHVLGVFTGQEKDLPAEQKIFGKDFAYIRDIRNFSRIVSSYLQKLLEKN